ncbi:MAG: TIGR02281 family clan AA aspartic protease [Phenylobacterium sp.]|jgi:aspartyl protease family protein|uniref:TIGR02281 family clan AA aspartic protease n=1 Tax=Phenylobacterium sp. TaxID=1871053 RepID=UPI002A35CCF9|nr:TIGR02281 family clan AA aspartic protease [Phenylobacterium sp.]MDX9996433.1 TIGR02281 family clan AA aspartic protease [Phenylobacterium sp.]
MLRFALLAAVSAFSAVAAAQAVSHFEAREAAAPRAAVAKVQPLTDGAEASGQAASIAKAADGHFWAEADVDGRRVRFLVDTGASAVALTVEDARRLGLDPTTLIYEYSVQTASGQARAAQVRLGSVAIAGARVNDVEAFVIEHGLETSLLGMTYLGRLSRFEATRSSLILRP